MSDKIEISKEYFVKHLVEVLESVSKRLSKVDDVLYEREDLTDEWVNVRESKLEIEEIVDALK